MWWLVSGCSACCLTGYGLVVVPWSGQPHGGARGLTQCQCRSCSAQCQLTGIPLLVPGQAPVGWARKFWPRAQSRDGERWCPCLWTPRYLGNRIHYGYPWQRSSELKSSCIWELRARPHSSQHSRMPVPCHLVPACNTCHESANLLPPSFLLFSGIRVLQVPSPHPSGSLWHDALLAVQEEGLTSPFLLSICAN